VKYVGASVVGKTNAMLVAGSGAYVADVYLPGTCHVAMVRSPYARARIESIDTSAADAVRGVVSSITGEEVRRVTKPIPTHSPALGEKRIKLYALAVEQVRYVGEPVAAVVAMEVEHQETLSPFNLLGCKGVGESAVAGPLASLCSAIEDALPHLKLDLMEMPLTPNRVWNEIQRAQQNAH